MVIPFLQYQEYYNYLTGAESYDFPYLPYGVAVAILGVIVVVIGIVIKDEPDEQEYEQEAETVSSSTTPMLKRYCRFCGAENKRDAVFCEKCGKQIA